MSAEIRGTYQRGNNYNSIDGNYDLNESNIHSNKNISMKTSNAGSNVLVTHTQSM